MLMVKKMKNIIFKIKTEYSLETYFLVVNEYQLIEIQIDDALASKNFFRNPLRTHSQAVN